MNATRKLVPVGWALWGLVALALLWGFVMVLVEENNSPEISREFGVIVAGVLLVVHAGVGLWLYRATRRRSSASLIIVTLLLAYPVVIAIAIPVIRSWEAWQFEKELARVGDYPDPVARTLSENMQAGNIARLRNLLAGGPPPTARDRAGNDLLAFAAVIVRDREGSPEIVRVLLEAGADPRKSRTPDGSSLLHFMVLDSEPSSVEVVRLLLEYGADPNVEDPQTGVTPMADAGAHPDLVRLLAESGANIDQLLPGGESMVVRFIGMQQWDSALYLIQKGANLDVTSPGGLSVDSYLNEFKDSVYGVHPEGWDRVREAIRTRRESPSVGDADVADPRVRPDPERR